MTKTSLLPILMFSILLSTSAVAYTGDTPTAGDIYGEDIAENNFRADTAIYQSKFYIQQNPITVSEQARSYETLSKEQMVDLISPERLIQPNVVTSTFLFPKEVDPLVLDSIERIYEESERKNKSLEQMFGISEQDKPQEFTQLQASFLDRRDVKADENLHLLFKQGTSNNAAEAFIESWRKWNLGIN